MKYTFIFSTAFLLFFSSHLLASHFWVGNVNHSWNNPANWDMGTVPGSGDDVFIVAGYTNECWVASTDQQCNNLFIMSGASFRIYDETLNVYGVMQIWGQLRMDNSDGFLIVHDNISWESGSTAQITAWAGIRTYENWEFKSGSTVHMNDGYVQMYGYDNNSIICKSADSYFNSLVIANNGGEIQFSGASTEPLWIKNGFAISSSDVFRCYSSQSIILDGEFTYNNGHFYMHSGTFIFNGDPSNVDCNTGDYFNNLTINSTGNVNMVSQLDINGDLTITSGNLVSNNHTIRIVGDWDNNIRPYGFDEGTGTVIFYGNGNQNCYGDHFYNLTIDKTYSSNYVNIYPTPGSSYQYTFVAHQTYIQDGYIHLRDNSYLSMSSITIDDGSKLDASSSTNVTVSLGGSWTDNNTSVPGFIEGFSRVLFTGGNFQQLTCPSLSSYEFFHITVNKSNGYFTTALDLNIFGNLRAESGGWTFNSPTPHHYFYGDIILDGGGFYEHCNTHFAGYSFQNIDIQSSSSHDFGPMIIDKGNPGYIITVLGDLPLYTSGGLTVESGIFKLDGSTFQCNNNITVNSAGVFGMVHGSTLEILTGHGLEVNSGGSFESIGTATNPNMVTGPSSNHYSFEIKSNASIGSKHTIFQYMDANGINVMYGGIVDTNFPFDYCTFQNSYYASTLLKLNCSHDVTITNAVFPANTWGGFYNVSRYNVQGVITFSWADGAFAGEAHDSDTYNIINWEYEPTLVSAKVFLEGPFNSTTMDADINSILPLYQPYSVSPWNYSGSENVASIPSSYIVDWVLLDLRTSLFGPSHAVDESSVAQRAAFLLNDGSLVETDGSTEISFDGGIGASDNVYLVVTHRNHLPILSANPLIETSGVWDCDLSASSNSVYGGLNACRYLASGIYGMIAGDANADETINESDVLPWRPFAGEVGYFVGDMDMNSQVNNQDKDDTMLPNLGMSSQLP